MERMAIRAADIHDDEIVEEICTLDRLAFDGTAPVLRAENGHWWVVYVGDTAVAYGGYVAARSNVGMAYFARSGVLPEFRGYGLQRRLIRVRERHARRQGFIGAVTDTRFNPPSANNLIACGFRMFEPQYPWAKSQALYWRKAF